MIVILVLLVAAACLGMFIATTIPLEGERARFRVNAKLGGRSYWLEYKCVLGWQEVPGWLEPSEIVNPIIVNSLDEGRAKAEEVRTVGIRAWIKMVNEKKNAQRPRIVQVLP